MDDSSEFWHSFSSNPELPAPFTMTLRQNGDRCVHESEVKDGSMLRIQFELNSSLELRDDDEMDELINYLNESLEYHEDNPGENTPQLQNIYPSFHLNDIYFLRLSSS